MPSDLRLIEDYLPIDEISRENTTAKGHINTLHLWWARRPLVACRAAVYGALVPADRWVPEVTLSNPPADSAKAESKKNGTKRGLNRAKARDFVSALCRHPGDARTIETARQHVLEAHADRLSAELAEAEHIGKPPAWVAEFKWAGSQTVTAKDIAEGRAPRPRVLDLFTGGGAIPLEAIRLGAGAIANELNPVAHLIELCTLVFPERYGKPDATPGLAGASSPQRAAATWGGLAEEVLAWGRRLLRSAQTALADIYPPVPDPEYKAKKTPKGLARGQQEQAAMWAGEEDGDGESVGVPEGHLMPVAYVWTRTAPCKNANCRATVPLIRSTWLCKREGRIAALRSSIDKKNKSVRFTIASGASEHDLGFDPGAVSQAGGPSCPFCGAALDPDYMKTISAERPFGLQPLAIMALRPGQRGKVYVPFEWTGETDREVVRRLAEIEHRAGISPPTEPLEANPRSFDVQRYGFTKWRSAFTERQCLMLLTFIEELRKLRPEMGKLYGQERGDAVYTCVAMAVSRLITQHNAFAMIHSGRETIEGPWGDAKFPMSWDFVEANPLSGVTGSFESALTKWAVPAYRTLMGLGEPATVIRGSATALAIADSSIDAVITDPPYYDSVTYSNLSDAFYVWLKRSLREVYPAHFASELTPKKPEAIKAAYRHGGDDTAAARRYEDLMTESLREAHRVLKPGGIITVVYAHKTTLGWSTLVDALRGAGFTITEAWPLDTEAKGGRKKVDKAMLASSIFLVARKRGIGTRIGNYEDNVQPELESVVRERVATLWEMGITGADLVIACVGAGLRAFTKYERVEYASGEPVPAKKFLAEVEAVVLDTLMERLLAGTRRAVANGDGGPSPPGVGTIDPISRFYMLWRYIYKAAELEAGEAITFANGLHVELDGQGGLTEGRAAVLEKKRGKYRLRDFAERGAVESLGLPTDTGQDAPLVDVLHRGLYLMEHRPGSLREFLDQARPNRERLRLLAASLAGPGLSGKSEEDTSRLVATTPAEQSALGKLLANWKALVPETLFDAGKR